MTRLGRRTFLSLASATAGTAGVGGVFGSLLARQVRGGTLRSEGYGALSPTKDEATGLPLLKLPAGFRYQSFGWCRDRMSTGGRTPHAHDGMGVIASDDQQITICRNHEVGGRVGRPFGPQRITYDPKAGGGCIHLTFDRQQQKFVSSQPSLTGTSTNCAGGPTPWGSWLSCEETVLGPGDTMNGVRVELEREHGYIFEVPASGAATAEPLKAMGRFVHEAVAVDPATDTVYETEDRDAAGFYRFRPNVRQNLAEGGQLEMLKVAGLADLRKGLRVGQKLDVTWVGIEDPDRAHSPGTKDRHGVFTQGKRQGAATFARLEGCWYGNGKIYAVSTTGGEARMGQVFEYVPADETIKLIFESPSAEVLNMPDNIAVSPASGGLVVCEDGDLVPQYLHGLTTEGELFSLAANNIVLDRQRNAFEGDFRGEEWAGATFSPDGDWLFVNIQRPGMTFAITGPWQNGALG